MVKLTLSEGQAKSALERVVERVLEGVGIDPGLVNNWLLESDGSVARLKAEVTLGLSHSEFQALLEEAAGHG